MRTEFITRCINEGDYAEAMMQLRTLASQPHESEDWAEICRLEDIVVKAQADCRDHDGLTHRDHKDSPYSPGWCVRCGVHLHA